MSLKNDMSCKLLELNGIQKPFSQVLTKVLENLEEINYPTPKYINNVKIKTNGYFLYDGCHKMYIIENFHNMEDYKECGYVVLPIELLPLIYEISCDLKFIKSADLNITYVKQFPEIPPLFTHKSTVQKGCKI